MTHAHNYCFINLFLFGDVLAIIVVVVCGSLMSRSCDVTLSAINSRYVEILS